MGFPEKLFGDRSIRDYLDGQQAIVSIRERNLNRAVRELTEQVRPL